VYGSSTRPVYTTRVHDCVRAVCTDVFGRVHGAFMAPYTGHVHGHIRAVHTAVYTTRIRPRTRVYVYKGCVQGVYGPSTRPKTAVYTAVHGRVTCRVYGRLRAVSARVHGSVRAVCTAVFRRVHWPCTLPFSAVYIARTRPCNGPCTRPLHCRVQGPSGPCIQQVGLPGRVHVQTARYGRVQPVTAYGPCTRPV